MIAVYRWVPVLLRDPFAFEAWVRACVTLFRTYCNFTTVKARVLNFIYGFLIKIDDPHCFSFSDLSPFWSDGPLKFFEKKTTLVSRISQKVFKLEA